MSLFLTNAREASLQLDTKAVKRTEPTESADRTISLIHSRAPSPPLAYWQQSAGNQAIQHLFRSGYIQAKLAISNPDDPEEREADHVANTIMRKAAGPHCSCSPGEEMCEECQQKQSAPAIQRRVTSPAAPSHVPHIVSDVLRSSGHPLDSATRAFFEPRFGHDFSDVRVHTDSRAADSARSIKAHAYTLGNDLVFGTGQFAPDTAAGRTLLAHELAHVARQSPEETTLRRFPMCSQLLSGNDTGRLVPESDVQEFLADELETV